MSGIVGAASGQRSGYMNDRLPNVAHPTQAFINTGTAASSGNGSSTNYTFQGINYTVHRFTQTRTDFIVTGDHFYCDALVVGGGGGGGANLGGGGHGAGGCYIRNLYVPAGTYTVTVGAGGGQDADGGASSFHTISSAGGQNGSNAGEDSVGVITFTGHPSTYDYIEAAGGYAAAISGGNANKAGSGACGVVTPGTFGLQQNSSDEMWGATGACGWYPRDYGAAYMYNGLGNETFAWGAGGGGPGYGVYAGHGGHGGGGGGGEFSTNSATGTGKGSNQGAFNDGDDGTANNDASNGGDAGANTGSGGGAGSHTGGGQTSARGGPGGSGIVLIRYRVAD